jgi:Domain of unknown function (DUF4283)
MASRVAQGGDWFTMAWCALYLDARARSNAKRQENFLSISDHIFPSLVGLQLLIAEILEGIPDCEHKIGKQNFLPRLGSMPILAPTHKQFPVLALQDCRSQKTLSLHLHQALIGVLSLSPTAMDRQNLDHTALVWQFEALVVRPNLNVEVQISTNEICNTNWKCCLALRVVTTRLIIFTHLRESLHKSWVTYNLVNVTRSFEGLYMAEFAQLQDRDRVINKAPWHFKHDVLALLPLTTAPEEVDKERCRIQVWVQLHRAPLSRMIKPTFLKLISVLGD